MNPRILVFGKSTSLQNKEQKTVWGVGRSPILRASRLNQLSRAGAFHLVGVVAGVGDDFQNVRARDLHAAEPSLQARQTNNICSPFCRVQKAQKLDAGGGDKQAHPAIQDGLGAKVQHLPGHAVLALRASRKGPASSFMPYV